MKIGLKIILVLSLLANMILVGVRFFSFDLKSIFVQTEDVRSSAMVQRGQITSVTLPSYIDGLGEDVVPAYQKPGENFDFQRWEANKKRKNKRNNRERVKLLGMSAASVNLYPYKAMDKINLEVKTAPEGKIGVYIISSIGNVEAFYEFKTDKGEKRKMSLDVSRLPKGAYTAHCVGGGGRVIKKFRKV